MMRLMTVVWILLVAGAGLGVILLKQDVERLEQDLHAANKQILEDQKQIHILRAEWSHFTDPERLKDLADKHLSLKPLKPDQITTFADLPPANGSLVKGTPVEPPFQDPTDEPEDVAEAPVEPDLAPQVAPTPPPEPQATAASVTLDESHQEIDVKDINLLIAPIGEDR